MRISITSARRRPRVAIATGVAALMVLAGAGFAAADITGPDVASYQHPGGASIDWSQVKNSGRNFAFVKATEGIGYVNPYFSADWAAIQANGMVRGSYHYAKPDTSPTSAAEQARYFVATAGLMQTTGDLAPILDLEDTGGLSPSGLITWVHSWLSTITALTGRTPILYTYPYFWRSAMGNDTGFTNYPLWIADYNGGSAPNTPLVGGWNSWTFWQYTDRGSIPGIPAGVDISSFCCDAATLSSLASGATPTPPSAILAHYAALGGASSYLGQVTSTEYAVPGGRAQNFTGGRIYWSPATGAHEVHGAILAHYLDIGGPSSPLGLPTRDESPGADGTGRYNDFSGGGALYWSPTVGAHEVHGAIDSKWGDLGWEMGVHGYPVTDEQPSADQVGRYNDFQDGSIYWSPTVGAHSIHGAIKAKWAQYEWETGFLGYPLTDELGTPDGVGRYNHLQGGSIYWTPTTNAHTVQGVIRDSWATQGWERGPLGYPTSDEYSVPGGRQSDFQGGTLFWDATTGVVSQR
jgi:GH25 family lysozyme M1 (1,4-beta-N-acetylmuramidase)